MIHALVVGITVVFAVVLATRFRALPMPEAMPLVDDTDVVANLAEERLRMSLPKRVRDDLYERGYRPGEGFPRYVAWFPVATMSKRDAWTLVLELTRQAGIDARHTEWTQERPKTGWKSCHVDQYWVWVCRHIGCKQVAWTVDGAISPASDLRERGYASWT